MGGTLYTRFGWPIRLGFGAQANSRSLLNWPMQAGGAEMMRVACCEARVRLKELHTGLRERHNVTIDSLTKELEADREVARANNQASAAVSATMSIARIHGLADGDKMIKFDIPTIEGAADAMAATAMIIQGVVQGDLAPEDAKAVATLVETYRRAVETVDLEERVSALE